MIIQTPIAECKFCSIVSKSNGEDPIGTAHPFDILMAIEIAQPWTEERLANDRALSQIHDLLHEFFDEFSARGIYPAFMAIAPDREYSTPGYARVLHYQRPEKLFAQFVKQEFLVPDDRLIPLTIALCRKPEELSEFDQYRQPESAVREMMVCTHGSVDVACARFGYPIYQQLRQQYADDRFRVWRCSHFGGHQFAPTAIDLPSGRVWGHLEAERLNALVHRHGAVADLRQFYRGWVGLTQFAQIVDREIWMQRGWQWFDYRKSAGVLARDTTHEAENADWAEVRLEFASPDGSLAGAYEARVEVCGSVMTARNSGEALVPVKQYRVSRLVQVA